MSLTLHGMANQQWLELGLVHEKSIRGEDVSEYA